MLSSRRDVMKGGVAWAALASLPGVALGSGAGAGRSDLPVYWNGWRKLPGNAAGRGAGKMPGLASPAAVCRDARHLDVFALGEDGRMWTNGWTLHTANSRWSGWARIGEGGPESAAAPAVVSRDADHLDIFVVGKDGTLWTNLWHETWGEWVSIAGGPFAVTDAPVAIARSATSMDVFVRGRDGRLLAAGWTGRWSAWRPVGGGDVSLASPPAVGSRDGSTLDLFVVGTDGRVYGTEWSGTAWRPWAPLPGGSFAGGGAPALVRRDGAHMDLFVTGKDTHVWTNTWAGSWGEWQQLEGGPATAQMPAAVAPDARRLRVFAVAGDGRTWSNTSSGDRWQGWSVVSDNPGAPAVSAFLPATRPIALQRDGSHVELLTGGNEAHLWRNTWGPAPAVYVPLSAKRLAQLTGDSDPTGLPHSNDTAKWGVSGTDMGCPVEFRGRLYLLFGDVPTTHPVDLDPICYTTDTRLSPRGFRLLCITDGSGQFRPMTVDGVGMLTNETATGAFAYSDRLFAFVVRGNDKPRSTLVSTADPEKSMDFRTNREISSPTGKFWQVAPWVVRNADWNGLPANSGDGVLLWGQSFDLVFLAWMPLTPGADPSPSTEIRYYAAGGTWSDKEADAVPLFSTAGITQISVTWLEGPRQWLFMYTHASNDVPHEGIVARVGSDPWTWSDELIVFDPDREQAWGSYMAERGTGPMHQLVPPREAKYSGYAYSPFLLSRFCRWDASTREVLLTYLMATFVPYQVMLMQARLQLDATASPTKAG